jgi:SAM-dependent methyltransferase
MSWEKINQEHAPEYPSEVVVSWASALPQGARVLDIGHGAGRHVRALRRQGFDCWGVDPFPAFVDRRAFLGDATSLSFPDNHFDAVLSFGVFYYLDPGDFKRAFQEAARVLKPGGQGLFVIRSQFDGRSRGGVPRLEIGLSFRCVTYEELDPAISQTGLRYFLGRQRVERPDRIDDDWLVYAFKL